MNFLHTDEQRMLADALDRYISKTYDFAARERIAYGAEGMSHEHWRAFSELGAIAALFPEELGGLGGSGFDVALVFEALGRGLVVEPLMGNLIVGRALAAAGRDDRAELLAALIGGTTKAALAHEEPNSHYEPWNVTTRASKVDGGWVLRGAKSAVQQGHHADTFLASARVHGGVRDREGMALFLVPKAALGVQVTGHARFDGGMTADLVLNDVHVADDALLCGPAGAADVLEQAIAWGLLALCAESLGAMESAKNQTLDHLRTRKQFGLPLGKFQALQHRMVDLLIEIEQARSAVINAAFAVSSDRLVRERTLSAAKHTVGRVGTLVAEECIQLHGGIGMTWELPLSHYAKRLVMIDHQFGDEDHHLARYLNLNEQLFA